MTTELVLKILLIGAMLATVGALTIGLFSMFKDGKEAGESSNKMMRYRIFFQPLAICIVSLLTSFVLPGVSPLAAFLHQARTVVRRAERVVCLLHESEPINPYIVSYINRLSDLLFVLARFDNHQKGGDVLWVPGAHR